MAHWLILTVNFYICCFKKSYDALSEYECAQHSCRCECHFYCSESDNKTDGANSTIFKIVKSKNDTEKIAKIVVILITLTMTLTASRVQVHDFRKYNDLIWCRTNGSSTTTTQDTGVTSIASIITISLASILFSLLHHLHNYMHNCQGFGYNISRRSDENSSH